MPKVLVTGGAGFIGSHLCEALVERGDQVTVLDDFSTSSPTNLHRLSAAPGCDVVTGSILDETLLNEVAAGCDWTAHLASAVGVRLIMDEPLRSLRTIVRGTELVLEAAHRHQHAKVLFTSTSEVYGRNPEVLSEESDRVFGPTTVNRWAYGTAKAVDEFNAFAFGARQHLPAVVARLFNTVGPRQSSAYGMVLPRFVDQAVSGHDLTVYGDGQQTRTFCHVNDAVTALLGLADHPAAPGRPFNVGSTDEVTMEDLAHRVIKIAGSSSGVRHIDFQAERAGDFQDVRQRRPDTRRIQALLGWRPRETLDSIIESLVRESRSRRELGL